MGLSIERIEILLLIAAVVAMLARRLRVPCLLDLCSGDDDQTVDESTGGDLRSRGELISHFYSRSELDAL